MAESFTIGEQIQGFEVTDISTAPMLKGTLVRLKDPLTGLDVFFLQNDDRNCGVNICCKTPCENDKGIPHILEHSVLMGSEKFPVRDPFFTIKQSSPNTFMNALTYADRTAYPISSQVEKDFDNLFQIYTDAVFFPLLRENSFLQEGHHLEFTAPNDGKLTRVGVVYNEMKGVLSDSDLLAYLAARGSIYQGSTYNYESGGIPAQIAQLSYAELKQYHQDYYHPSNICISFYGSLDIVKYLKYIRENVLVRFPKKHKAKDIKPQPKLKDLELVVQEFQKPEKHTVSQSQILIAAFLGPQIKTIDDYIDWEVLEILLFENDFSPMKYALDNSGLGETGWIYSGIEIDFQAKALLGIKGASQDNVQQLYDLIIKTCETLIAQGVYTDKIEHALKRMQISSRSYQTPFDVTSRISKNWRYGLNPADAFDIDGLFNRLNERIRKPNYFANLIKQLFIENEHYNFTYMKPTSYFAEQERVKEEEELHVISTKLSAIEQEVIRSKSKELEKERVAGDSPADLNKLPTIQPLDITTKLEHVPQELTQLKGNKLLFHPINTSGLVHADILIDMSNFDRKLLKYLPLYTELIGRIGAAGLTSEQMTDRIDKEIAQRVSAETTIKTDPDGDETFLFLNISSSSLLADVEKLQAILFDYIKAINFADERQLKLTIDELFQMAASSATYEGYATGIYAGFRHYNLYGLLTHELNGAGYVQSIREIYQQSKDSLEYVQQQLQEIHQQFVLNVPKYVIITADKENETQVTKLFTQMLEELPVDIQLQQPEFEVSVSHDNEIWLGETQVAYVTQTFPTVAYAHEDQAALVILSSILGDLYLHTNIREQGGAYGAYANVNESANQFYMYTVRDPHIASSIYHFQKGIDWICKGKFSQTDVDNAICQMMGKIDAPQSPSSKGFSKGVNTLVGLSDDLIESQRSQVLKVNKADIIRVAQKYLQNQSTPFTIVTGKELLARELTKLKDFKFTEKQI